MGDLATKTVLDRIEAYLVAATPAAILAAIAVIDDFLDTEIAALTSNLALLNAIIIKDNVKVYPTLAAGVTVTGAAGAWTNGASAEIIPAATVTVDSYPIGIVITAISAGSGEVRLRHGASDTEFARIPVLATGTVMFGPCKKVPANDKVTAVYASLAGGAQTADFKLIFKQ